MEREPNFAAFINLHCYTLCASIRLLLTLQICLLFVLDLGGE